MKTTALLTAIVLIVAVPLYAQDPCSDPDKTGLLRIGKSYTAPCDSLYILSRQKYYGLYAELKFYKDLNLKNDSLIAGMENTKRYTDSLNALYVHFIGRQDSALAQYRSQLTWSDSLVVRSTENTDRALKELEDTRLRMWIMTGIAALAGVALGAFVLK